MAKKIEFGLLMPHFTQHASAELLFESARMADALGFDSLWVRDHLFLSPDHREHGGILEPGYIVEATMALAAMSAVTSHARLGSAIITPHRHALKVAQLFGTLDHLSGGRAILGIGAGWDLHEFAAAGIPFEQRVQAVRETVEVCRLGWSRPDFRYQGKVFQVPWGSVDPRPAAGTVPVWYGGLSYKAVELAVEFGDGWIPSRIPYDRLRDRIERAKSLLGSPERSDGFTFAAMPQTAVAASAEEALRGFDLGKVEAEALKRKPVSGGRGELTLQDLEGYLIWGNAEDLCGHVERFIELDVTHVVFDMRAQFDRFLDNVKLLGEQVLPRFR